MLFTHLDVMKAWMELWMQYWGKSAVLQQQFTHTGLLWGDGYKRLLSLSATPPTKLF